MFRYIWVEARMHRIFSPAKILTGTKRTGLCLTLQNKVQVCLGDAGQMMRAKQAGIRCRSLSLIVPNTVRRTEISAQSPKAENTRSTFLLHTRIKSNFLDGLLVSLVLDTTSPMYPLPGRQYLKFAC
jgi:hypothetical protein